MSSAVRIFRDPLLNGRHELMTNATSMREEALRRLLDPSNGAVVDEECGYPVTITKQDYRKLYEREPLATRVIHVLPNECWGCTPTVYEDEDSETITAFEEAWDGITKTLRGTSFYKQERGSPVWEYLKRVDQLSGIGSFGLLLIGIDDGLPLDQPVAGIEEDGTFEGEAVASRKLLYLRAFDESYVEVAAYEKDSKNPRYGQPTYYNITMNRPDNAPIVGEGLETGQRRVHWTRVLHVADNLDTSEIFGVPRMRPVYNRLHDLHKLYGGSAEMYWQGAFGGLSLETHPQLGGDVAVDAEATRDQLEDRRLRLQRDILLMGMHATPLAPTVVDPTPQINVQIEAICILIGVPKRVFMGSERGELSSSQDDSTWNERKAERQNNYLTPRLIVPFIDRLIAMGVLPVPVEFCVEWPDLEALSDIEKATVMTQRTQALSAYMSGGVDMLIPPMDYLTRECYYTEEEAQTIIENAEEHVAAKAEEEAALQEEQMQQMKEVGLEHQEAQAGPDGTKVKLAKPQPPMPPVAKPKAPPVLANKGKLAQEGANGTDHPFSSTENFDPSQPRDASGKWSAGLRSAVGGWFDFENASAIKAASRGDDLTKHSTTSGESLTPKEIEQFKSHAKEIQAAAEAGNTGEKLLWRGQVLSDSEIAQLKVGKTVEIGSLTATAKDKNVASIYTDKENFAGGEGHSVLFQIENPKGIKGLAIPKSEDHPGGEFILPKGSAYRVTRMFKEGDKTIVSLYAKKGAKGDTQNYDPQQPRQKDGKWGTSGGQVGKAFEPKIGDTVITGEGPKKIKHISYEIDNKPHTLVFEDGSHKQVKPQRTIDTSKPNTPQGPATQHSITTGEGLKSHLASSDGKFTNVQMDKIAILNPEGLNKGVVKVPKAINDAQMAHLQKTLPPGTKIQKVNASKLHQKKSGEDIIDQNIPIPSAAGKAKKVKAGAKAAADSAGLPGTYGGLKPGHSYYNTQGKKKTIASIVDDPMDPKGKVIVKFEGEKTGFSVPKDKGLPNQEMHNPKMKALSAKAKIADDASLVDLKVSQDMYPSSAFKEKLSSGERNAISDWSNGEYGSMRKRWGAGTPNEKDKAFIAGLEKAPPFNGTIHRGIKTHGAFGAKLLNDFKTIGVGGVWSDKAPMSTSTSVLTAGLFSGGGIMLTIKSKTGRPIKSMSQYKHENEIVTMPGTQYKVTKITDNAFINNSHKALMHVHLEEI